MEPKAEGLTSERAAPPRLGRRGEEPFQDPETNEQEEGATMDSEPTPSTSSHPPRHEAKVDPSHRRVGFFDGRETKGGNDDAPDDARGAGGGPTEDDAALESNADEEVSSLHHSARSSLPQSSPSCREGGSSEEESVAEMDYMSEGSNLSVKGLLPASNSGAVDPGGGSGSDRRLGDEQEQLPPVAAFLPSGSRGTGGTMFAPPPRESSAYSGSVSGSAASTVVYHPSPLRSTDSGPASTSTEVPVAAARGAGSSGGSLVEERSGFRPPHPHHLDPPGVDGNDNDGIENDSQRPAAVSNGESSSSPQTHHSAGPGEYLHHHLHHRPLALPQFRNPDISMWTASHAANSPTEDRSASLVNVLLQPLPPNFDSETQLPPLEPDYQTLIRLNLWCVIDGHGGGCVATYASEVLLPHVAASVSRMLGCAIVDRGVCTVNGQLRDANALDLDGLIKTCDRSMGNPNSIHYRSPFERSDSEEEEELEEGEDGDLGIGADDLANLSELDDTPTAVPETRQERKRRASLVKASLAQSQAGGAETVVEPPPPSSRSRRARDRAAVAAAASSSSVAPDASVSSVKTSVKTAASPANREALVGTHSPQEVAAITRAITESFLAVDEGWINSIDPVATHQTSCQSNGRWNSGACALVVFTIQRLDWTSVSEPDRGKESREPEANRRNTSQNRDAARRRMLDYAARAKSASSMSTVSSTSSLTTEEAVNASGPESEITETEGEDDRSYDADLRKRNPSRSATRGTPLKEEFLISPPGGCSCHCYRAHDAILYTAHVGDCRAVMLGSAPPRTIKVRDRERDGSHQDTTDDESSHHSSDETECLSSSDHDADSSEEEDVEQLQRDAAAANAVAATATSVASAASGGGGGGSTATTTASTATSSYMNVPRRVVRQKSRRLTDDASGPYIALPPLLVKDDGPKTVEFDFETDISHREGRRSVGKDPSVSSGSTNDSFDLLPLVNLPPSIRPIDLTTDHSAYNPAEVTAVLRRCNNAPRAISAGVGGGIKRVAGSLAVTRALGDAYLKTPLLSFLPYKSHAPYITGRPEVNCRPLVKDADKVLVLATDGVWERASGEDILRWVRNFYEERVAEAERNSNRRLCLVDKASSNEDTNGLDCPLKGSQETSERDLFEKNDLDVPPASNRKHNRSTDPQSRRSPSPPAKRRKRGRQNRISYNVADVIVRRVLNKVRRARNISSLQTLMSLPQGRARRSKHDDITASVVDLSAFVS